MAHSFAAAPPPDIQRLLQAAAAAAGAGRAGEAARLYEQLLARDPANPMALNALGAQAQAAGDLPRARGLFERAVAADPSSPRLLLNLASVERAAGDDAAEERALRRALDLDQRLLMAHLRLAELHERRGEEALAWRHWGSVVAAAALVDPKPPGLDAVVARAQAYVSERNDGFARTMDAALAPARDGLTMRERRRFDAALDATLGRRRIYANQCQGLHFPFLPADEWFERHHFPWMDALEAKTPAIRAELEHLLGTARDRFTPYVEMEKGVPTNVWSALDHNLDWSALHLWRHGAKDEEVCARCPETTAALAALPQADIDGRSPTAFFSVLKPRTVIPPHGGVTNVRATCHLALVVPEGCRFRVGGETRAWREGECFAFDDTIEHEAWNDSDHTRAVLIFDVWNPHLSPVEQALIRAFFAAADASEVGGGLLGT
jgi:aspartyl/asparaginyl beta-hydroxylase (cupin superfamily)